MSDFNVNDVVGKVFGKDKQKLLESNNNTRKNKRLAKIKESLKNASLLHYGIKKYITFAEYYYIELMNGWVVQMDRINGKKLHIYEDKTNDS